MTQTFATQTAFYNSLNKTDSFDGYRITRQQSGGYVFGTVKFQHDNSVIVFWKTL